MKRTYLIALLLGAIISVSCDNAEEMLEATPNEFETANENIISSDSLFAIGNEMFATWEHTGMNTSPTRSMSSVVPVTVYGYSSYTSTGNRKIALSSDLASKFNVITGVYIMETLTVQYNLTISGLGDNVYFSSADSPNCGINPLNSSNIGYAHTQVSETVTMTTKLQHLVSSISGIAYDRWYPCKPNELQWNYLLIN